MEDFIDGEYADGLDDESEGLRSDPTGAPEVIDPTPMWLTEGLRVTLQIMAI